MVHTGTFREDEAPSWLPPGSRVRIARQNTVPEPMCLVRLLLRRDAGVFVVPRDDSGKLDLPTLRPPGSVGSRAIVTLAKTITGSETARFLGSVGNVVPVPTTEYEWPTPHAFFGVWESDADPIVPGQWLDSRAPDSPIRERHWYPLLELDRVPAK